MNREPEIVKLSPTKTMPPGQISSEIFTEGDLLSELEDILESVLLKCQVLTICSCGTELVDVKKEAIELAPMASDLNRKNARLREINRKLRWLLNAIEI